MNSFLRVAGLNKSYPSGTEILHILSDLELEVPEKQMLAVTGASGSGKSTFLHLVGGMEKPDSGQIFVGPTDVTALKGEELARFRNQQVGFVFQFHHLLPEFSALENVMFPLLLRREGAEPAAEKARQLLVEVGLERRMGHKPGQLSGGEQQRVAIARALVGRPRLLLADEPTGNLDSHTAETVHELLRNVHEQHGLTSILVSHNPRLAAICDRERNMREGKLVETVS